ncbi:GNAT family N-acetyltransferase [Nocardia miyunensis]|uniref:GNAT family N-acetyltransferase n=1 Tax=Nocardia miyunensis TaxID=282684 RepID=UPI001470E59C|nr:GNAT family N-acetyltransferase [Nocardia miyunensis]
MSASTTQIHVLSGDDWALFRDIRLRALADAPAAFGANLPEAQSRTEQQWRNRISQRTQFVAVTEQGTVGTVAGAVDTDRNSVHLFSMWVDPRVRGTGIADQLVQTVVAWAAANGHTTIHLEVTEHNSRAERLYARNGFTRTGRIGTISRDDPRAEFEMTRTISETPS